MKRTRTTMIFATTLLIAQIAAAQMMGGGGTRHGVTPPNGIGDRTGSIEAGRTADLVLLRGDLTQDPLVIRNVVTVFKDGVGYDSARLLRVVRGRVGIN